MNFEQQNRKSKVAFPATMWNDITAWKDASIELRIDILTRFYTSYRLPLISYIIFSGYGKSDSEDLLHDFIIVQAEGDIFLKADPGKGRFRNLLLTSLKHFLISNRRKLSAKKRHPEGGMLYLESEVTDGLKVKDYLSCSTNPEEIFHKAWLASLLMNVYKKLRTEFYEKEQYKHIEIFERRIYSPIMDGSEGQSIADLAGELSISPEDASNYLTTAKRAFRRLLKQEIGEYVTGEKEINEEINDFLGFIGNLNKK